VLNQALRHEDVLEEWRYNYVFLTLAQAGGGLAPAQSQFERGGEQKNILSLPLPGIEPRSSCQ
jgi:hypothetical protein